MPISARMKKMTLSQRKSLAIDDVGCLLLRFVWVWWIGLTAVYPPHPGPQASRSWRGRRGEAHGAAAPPTTAARPA